MSAKKNKVKKALKGGDKGNLAQWHLINDSVENALKIHAKTNDNVELLKSIKIELEKAEKLYLEKNFTSVPKAFQDVWIVQVRWGVRCLNEAL